MSVGFSKEFIRNDSSSSLKVLKKGRPSDPMLLPPIETRLQQMMARNRHSLDMKPLIQKIYEIASNDAVRLILIQSVILPQFTHALVHKEDLHSLQALPPFPLLPPPDFESFSIDEVRRFLSLPPEKINAMRLRFNNSRFSTIARDPQGSAFHLIQFLSDVGWEMNLNQISSTAKKIREGKRTGVTKLFQAASAYAAQVHSLLAPCGAELQVARKHPDFYIFSRHHFVVLHEKPLQVDDVLATALIANIYNKGVWRSTLYLTDIPEVHRKKFRRLERSLHSILSPNPDTYLARAGKSSPTKIRKDKHKHYLPQEFLKMQFDDPDQFYVAVHALVFDRQQLLDFEKKESKAKYCAVSEYTKGVSSSKVVIDRNARIQENALSYLDNIHRTTLLFEFPLLLNLESVFKRIPTQVSETKLLMLESGRFAVIASSTCAFTKENREIFSATVHSSLTYVHKQFIMKQFMTHIRPTDPEIFRQEVLPIFRAYEESLLSYLILKEN